MHEAPQEEGPSGLSDASPSAAPRNFDPTYDRLGSCVTSADVSIGGAQLYER